MWTWIATGVGIFVFLSTAVAIVVARTLALIAQDVSALDAETWATLPLSREAERQASSRSDKAVAA